MKKKVEKHQKQESPGNLSVNWAAVMLCGEMLGASSLSLSHAIQSTGFYTGIAAYCLITLVSFMFAVFLGKSYTTARASYPDEKHLRDPYPRLAEFAMNKKARYAVIGFILLSDILGASTLLVFASNVLIDSLNYKFSSSLSASANMRIWIFLTVLFVLPFTWNDRLKDNKLIAFIALTSSICCNYLILLLYLLASGVEKSYEASNEVVGNFETFVVALGILLSTADGFDVLPSIQEDMENINKYKPVIFKGYIMSFILNAPVMIGGYFYFHHHHILNNNILAELFTLQSRLEHGFYKATFDVFLVMATLFCIFHILSTIVLQLNPSFQYIETIFICPEGLCFKRIVIRTSIMAGIFFIIELAPTLLPFMSITGTIIFVFLGIVIPGITYLILYREEHSMFKNVGVIFIGVLFSAFLIVNVVVNISIIARSAEKTIKSI